jgi:hypothetical protein
MNYSTIIAALPKDVSDLLHKNLDGIELSGELSKDEATELLEGAVKLTKIQMIIEDDEKRRLVDSLLTMVVPAGLKALFP